MNIEEKSDEELDEDFAKAQEQITALQAMEAAIASERRRRRFAVELAAKREELKALEEKLNATG